MPWFGRKSLEKLGKAIEDDDLRKREEAAESIVGLARDGKADPASALALLLVRLCHEKDVGVSFKIASQFSLLWDETQVDWYGEELTHVRAHYVYPSLSAPTDGTVVASLADVLGKVKDSQATPHLLSAMRKEGLGGVSSWENIVSALVAIGDSRAVRPLLQVVKDIATATLESFREWDPAGLADLVKRAQEAAYELGGTEISLQLHGDQLARMREGTPLQVSGIPPSFALRLTGDQELRIDQRDRVEVSFLSMLQHAADKVEIESIEGPVEVEDSLQRTVGRIGPRGTKEHWLMLRPTQVGSRVPVRLHISFLHELGSLGFICDEVIEGFIAVFPAEEIEEAEPPPSAPPTPAEARTSIAGPRRFTHCPYCGETLGLPKTPRFCPHCGESLPV